MNRLAGAAGFLIGLLLGSGLLLLNPLSFFDQKPVALSGAVSTLGWESAGHIGMALRPARLLGLTADSSAAFVDPGIRHARAELVVMSGEAGSPSALGVRFSAVAPGNNLLRARLGVTTAWNIVWPGRGSLQLNGSENFWAPLRDGSWSAARGRGFVPGASRYPLPPVPRGREPRLVAGSGEFAGKSGVFREEFSPSPVSADEFSGLRQLHFSIE
ncbi:MAG: hypothetical protein FJ197_00425 [Gammaproteobacteria bacterium]|nr:hypothetical protein [Gammaproteobacteria bacterium]